MLIVEDPGPDQEAITREWELDCSFGAPSSDLSLPDIPGFHLDLVQLALAVCSVLAFALNPTSNDSPILNGVNMTPFAKPGRTQILIS